MRLKDKVILVTGSVSGIGEGMVRTFAREGAIAVIHGPTTPEAESAARHICDEITEAGGRASWTLDPLEDPATPPRLIKKVIERHGRLDGLVNNAAVLTRGTLEQTNLELFEQIMAVNLRAPFFLVQAALPHFRAQGVGRVINIGSINAYSGDRTQCAYSISKGALMTFTRNIADAYGRDGVRMHQINVGWTLTPREYALKRSEGFGENWPSEVSKEFAPSGRLLTPEDIAWAAVYLLSDEAALVNGTVFELEQFPLIGRMQERNPPK